MSCLPSRVGWPSRKVAKLWASSRTQNETSTPAIRTGAETGQGRAEHELSPRTVAEAGTLRLRVIHRLAIDIRSPANLVAAARPVEVGDDLLLGVPAPVRHVAVDRFRNRRSQSGSEPRPAALVSAQARSSGNARKSNPVLSLCPVARRPCCVLTYPILASAMRCGVNVWTTPTEML